MKVTAPAKTNDWSHSSNQGCRYERGRERTAREPYDDDGKQLLLLGEAQFCIAYHAVHLASKNDTAQQQH